MKLYFPAITQPNTPSLGALSGQKDGHPQTQGRSRAAAVPRPEAGRLSFLDPWGGGQDTQAADDGVREHGSRTGEQGTGVLRGPRSGLVCAPLGPPGLDQPARSHGAYRVQSPGNVHPGQEGRGQPQGWPCLDDSGSRLITHCSADPRVARDDNRPLQ